MRSMDLALQTAQTAKGNAPTYRVNVYDIRTSGDTFGDLVEGAGVSAPLDISEDVLSFTITERGNDIVQGSIGGASVSMEIQDNRETLDPVAGSNGRWLRSGNILEIVQGDSTAPGSTVVRFRGKIVGRAGATEKNRRGDARLTIQAEDRMVFLSKKPITSRSFGQGYSFVDMMISIVQEKLGLSVAEYDFGGIGMQFTTQLVTQFVDEPATLALAKLMFQDGFTPHFNGDGTLGVRSTDTQKGPEILYEDRKLFAGFARPASAEDNPNEVAIVGLDSDMTKILQPTQQLARASLTLGFFGGDAEIGVRWSEDGSQQAENARLKVNTSVTGALIPFGDEDFTPAVDGDGGSRSGTIDVGGAFYAPLVVTLYAGSIAASFIPDTVPLTGQTIPVGRLIEAVLQILTSTIQATIGRGDYEIIGEPYEMVFQEIRGVARVLGVDPLDVRSLTVENHLIDTQTEVNTVAVRELRNVLKRAQPYRVRMRQDLRLEVHDKFLFTDDFTEFIVTQISQTVTRDGVKEATVDVFETTPSVNP